MLAAQQFASDFGCFHWIGGSCAPKASNKVVINRIARSVEGKVESPMTRAAKPVLGFEPSQLVRGEFKNLAIRLDDIITNAWEKCRMPG